MFDSGCSVVAGVMDLDFQFALKLQEQFDREAFQNEVLPIYDEENDQITAPSVIGTSEASKLSTVPAEPVSVVDGSWELIDPNPDVRALFLQFNDLYFWGKLSGVEVRWSPRMTLCAGLCCYEGRGGLCSIRLSEPLLKLRPRKDLVQTLLHEMIHALLFVTNNNKDHDSHGPEFCKHMHRINNMTGAKITIYHSFHDEVDKYRQHWWRCNGPCQSRPPYFGYVKRAMNRAPSNRDPWWDDHQRSCGGVYAKIKEPENYSKKGKKEKKEGSSEVKLKSPNGSDSLGKNFGADICTFASFSEKGEAEAHAIVPFSGKGYKLGGNSSGSSSEITSSSKVLAGSSLNSHVNNSNASRRISSQGNQNNSSSVGNNSNQKSTSSLSHWLLGSSKTGSLQSHLPKKSVANHKAFKNINGSPVKIFTASGSKKEIYKSHTKNSPSGLLSEISKKRSFSGEKEATQSTSVSQQSCSSAGIMQQPKRLCTEDDRPFAGFLAKTKSDQKESSKSSGLPSIHREETQQASSQIRPNNTSSRVVSCPVCQAAVNEFEINQHLDACLT